MNVSSVILGALLVVVIIMIVSAYMQSENKPVQQASGLKPAQTSTDSKLAITEKPSSTLSQPQSPPPIVVKPRPTSIVDCGYNSSDRGWYDAQKQGAKNDYCRRVGDGSWFSCQLAGKSAADGADWHLTPKGAMDHLIGQEFDSNIPAACGGYP